MIENEHLVKELNERIDYDDLFDIMYLVATAWLTD